MKHAFLITAYNNFENLERLLSLLDDTNSVIFLHIDIKAEADQSRFLNAVHFAELHFVPSMSISWAGASMIEGTLQLLKHSMNYDWEYCHYITENDLPLKTVSEIDSIVGDGCEFVDFAPENYAFAHYKCDVYHFFTRFPAYRKSKILKVFNHGLAKLQWRVGVRRNRWDYKHGSAYFSISRDFASYIVERAESILEMYQHTLAGDEVWLQTLCEQSPYKARVKYYEQQYLGNLRYIDWERRDGSSPYTFQVCDYEDLIDKIENSDLCFARKFSRDSEVANRVYEYMRLREKK